MGIRSFFVVGARIGKVRHFIDFLGWSKREVGGNKILFQDRGIKIFLDFGMSFYDLGELVEIKPEPDSCYLLSASEPFTKRRESTLNVWSTGLGITACRSIMRMFLDT